MNVIVMRRELTVDERTALMAHHPDEVVNVHTSFPKTPEEHLANCEEYACKIAFLPTEKPIPALAMEAGVRHLLLKDGKLLELVRVVPEFKPYEPKV